MGTELPFCKMKSVLGTDGGDGGQTRRTSLMPRLVHLKRYMLHYTVAQFSEKSSSCLIPFVL